eukprot:6209728-Pleurochrysis_carterae.AAC.1
MDAARTTAFARSTTFVALTCATAAAAISLSTAVATRLTRCSTKVLSSTSLPAYVERMPGNSQS